MRLYRGAPLSFLCCSRCAHSMARARRQPRAPLTRDYGVTRPGRAKLKWNSTALLVRKFPALVAQLDRAPDFESGGRGFESLRARQLNQRFKQNRPESVVHVATE